MPNLIVIRGPSGSGKSSIARKLSHTIRCTRNKMVILLEQDYIRNVIIGRETKGIQTLSSEILLLNARHFLTMGVDVIIEGILNMVYYKDLFDTLIREFSDVSVNFFYLDVSLEETFARHQTRAKLAEFTCEEMSSWWSSAQPSEYSMESRISQCSSLESSVEHIIQICYGKTQLTDEST